MNISRFFVTTAAAVTVVGAIGVAYAQITPYSSPGTTTSPQTQSQATTPNQSTPAEIRTPNQPPIGATSTLNDRSTGAMGQGSTSNTNERAPRADRN